MNELIDKLSETSSFIVKIQGGGMSLSYNMEVVRIVPYADGVELWGKDDACLWISKLLCSVVSFDEDYAVLNGIGFTATICF